MIIQELQGLWGLCMDAEKKHQKPPESNDTIFLPNSTAHAKKGIPNDEPDLGHMTDRYYFEGYAWYSKKIYIEEEWIDKEITLFLERTRISTVFVDGEEINTENSLCGFHKHHLTGKLSPGEHCLTIRVDNTAYPTKGGHMTSPDTQTNWNGIVGRIELQIRENGYPHNLQIFAETPEAILVTADICGDIEGIAQISIRRKEGELLYQSSCPFINRKLKTTISLEAENLLWDEYHTNLLTAEIKVGKETDSVSFGIRKLSHDGRRMLINEKEVFFRGKHDGLVFPNTGYAPMTVEEWKKVFATVKEYGINHYRFHTCCPPDAAFTAADEMGIYMEPELPFWGSILAPDEADFHAEEQSYLIEEGYRILKDFGNHPSFVMLSMGNELWGSMERINEFLHGYKAVDKRHFYTQGSNNFQFCPAVLDEEDVFCGVRLAENRLFRGSYAMCDAPQGHIQTEAPNAFHNYDEIIAPKQVSEKKKEEDEYIEIQYGTGTKKVKTVSGKDVLVPQIPVLSHEIGQYDFFPDFTELDQYEGSQQPLYLKIYQERMEKSDIFKQWKELYEATGAFAVDCYRREIETAMRSQELSGFQLLDLQDFPGQDIALVGILNSWLENKGLVTSKEWRCFCNDTVILAELKSFVVTEGENLKIPLKLSVCNRESFKGEDLSCRILFNNKILKEEKIHIGSVGDRRLQEVGCVTFTVPELDAPAEMKIELQMEGTEYYNEYFLWAYPDEQVKITETEITYENKKLLIAHTPEETEIYKAEKRPFLYVPVQTEEDVEGCYCTDFWNYPMFRKISESMNRKVPIGTLGLYINKEHKFFEGFPCEKYSTPQWYQLVTHSHCSVLNDKKDVNLLVQPIDNVERCQKLGMLYMQGETLVCTSRIWEIAEYPEVRAFAKALISYLI